MADIRDDIDDFWDISKLIPKKKSNIPSFSTHTPVSDVVVESKTEDESGAISAEDRKLDFSAYKPSDATDGKSKEEYSYVPRSSRLIRKVMIKPSHDRFDFYDTFRKAALIYFDYKCQKCEFTPFYSYKPQYSQMTPEQKKYYFYWRDELRRKKFLKTDYSYVYLYAYEILNLPEKIGKEEGLSLLIEVWRAYRAELPRLDTNFSVWVQDYCLVYELECPFDEIKDFLFDIINVSSFKEFYLSDIRTGGNEASAMLAYLSDYDWRKGKYAGGENAEMYRMHVEGAMQQVFAHLFSDEIVEKSDVNKITRTAFPGSLCTHTVKCILEIEYSSISSSPELRRSITAALKYTENKLRAILGIKSRLAIKDLPDLLRKIIDRYFEYEFAKLKRERERANMPEYEKLYDAPESNVSFEDAIEIEKASWRMTARLVEGTEDQIEVLAEEAVSKICETAAAEIREETHEDADIHDAASDETADYDTYGLSFDDISFLRAVASCENDRITAIAKEQRRMPEAIAEKINEAFADNFGDVILEESDEGMFVVIEDYTEEIIEWLSKIPK